jgi:hypothetical protein
VPRCPRASWSGHCRSGCHPPVRPAPIPFTMCCAMPLTPPPLYPVQLSCHLKKGAARRRCPFPSLDLSFASVAESPPPLTIIQASPALLPCPRWALPRCLHPSSSPPSAEPHRRPYRPPDTAAALSGVLLPPPQCSRHLARGTLFISEAGPTAPPRRRACGHRVVTTTGACAPRRAQRADRTALASVPSRHAKAHVAIWPLFIVGHHAPWAVAPGRTGPSTVPGF